MGSSSNSSDDELVAAINVTPLVDVVLVLLVIFLITAPVIYQSAIKVQLPKAATGENNANTPLSFTLDREGAIAWGNEKLSWPEVESRLAKTKEARPRGFLLGTLNIREPRFA